MLSGQHKMVGDDVRFRLVTHGEQETRDDYTRHEKLHERVSTSMKGAQRNITLPVPPH